MLMHPIIHRRDMPAAFMGSNMAAISDTTDNTTYRDMVWDIRTILEPCKNERRLEAWCKLKYSTKIRCGIRGKNQGPLFMIWKEYLDNGKVEHANVLFNSRDRFGI